MMVMSRSPKTTMAAVRGIGRRRHHQQIGVPATAVGAPPLGPQRGPLLHPEAVLLVDDHHPEGTEPDLVGEEGVGPDQEVDGAVGQAGVERGPLGGARLVGEQGDPAAGGGPRASTDPAPTDPSTRAATSVACCSASTSVGAISAPWWPPSTATSMAATATTVFPEPTSPWRSRCMGSGPARSARMAVHGPALGFGRA